LPIDKDTHDALRPNMGGIMGSSLPLRCLVTGAGRGIGRAVSEELAAAGHRVALLSRTQADLDELAADLPVETLVLPADVTDPASATNAISALVEAWGGIDVLVLNAGEGVAASITKTDDAMWDHTIELNLTAPFRFLRAAVSPMKEAGFGRVVVVASLASLEGMPYVSAYTAAKHGVLGLVRAAAAELSLAGVTVNAVCPGFVDTPMTERSLAAIMSNTGRTREQALTAMLGEQPRLIAPREVADEVMRCIDDATVNGQAIIIDGRQQP
jgi:NAD(P)-dependent dehydrogenase (short-subunit alcohol dehydrogenase family)